MKLLNIFTFITILIFISCDKNDGNNQINPCANGKKDTGEIEIDCGGTCPECPTYAYMVVRRNGEVKQVSSKSIVKEGENWLLVAGFDSLLFQINLGTELIEGINPMKANSTGAAMVNRPYTFVSGILGISRNNLTKKELSGNFEATFVHQMDTLKLKDGQFEHIKY
jgi:hypothetical protein